MANPGELINIRKQLDAMTSNDLQALSAEDLKAFVVTLRKALDMAEEARTGKQVGGDEEWDRLST